MPSTRAWYWSAAGYLAAILSFNEFTASLFVTAQRTQTLPVAMYNYVREYADPSMAALSVMYIVAHRHVADAGQRLLGLGKVLNVESSPVSVPSRRPCRSPSLASSSNHLPFGCIGASKRFGKVLLLQDATLSDPPRRAHDPARAVGVRQNHFAQSGRRVPCPVDDGGSRSTADAVTNVPTYKREIGMMFQSMRCFRT